MFIKIIISKHAVFTRLAFCTLGSSCHRFTHTFTSGTITDRSTAAIGMAVARGTALARQTEESENNTGITGVNTNQGTDF